MWCGGVEWEWECKSGMYERELVNEERCWFEWRM